MNKIITIIIALILIGCATPYQQKGIRGGYSDQPMGEGQFFVTVEGNGYTSKSTTIMYLNRRAMELCTQSGYRSYQLQQPNAGSKDSVVVWGNKNTTTATQITKHDVSALVVCIRWNVASKRKYISNRLWLNTDKKLTACASWQHIVQEGRADVFLTIKDCYRTVTLDFHYGNKRSKKKALVKINKLINMLTELKKVIEKELNFWLIILYKKKSFLSITIT